MPFWDHFGVILVPCWAVEGPRGPRTAPGSYLLKSIAAHHTLWTAFERLLRVSGGPLGVLGRPLGVLGAALGRPGGVLGRCFFLLWRLGGAIGRPLGVQGASWVTFGIGGFPLGL